VGKIADEEEQMYPQRRISREALEMGLMALIVLTVSACGGGSGAKSRAAEEASKPELTTVAGDGGEQLGDGGPATKAGLCGPTDVALDAKGNMYISNAGTIATVPVATPFGRWILMGPSPPSLAPESTVSPAMEALPPRHDSIPPMPWRWTGTGISTSETGSTIGFAR
jgi:hypothetical protein